MENNNQEVKYYRKEFGGIVRLTNGDIIHLLDISGEWILDQDVASTFHDGMIGYEEVAVEEVEKITNFMKDSEDTQELKF